MKFSNVRYIVHDVEAAITFYTELLNFKLRHHPAPGFAILERNGISLLLNQPGAGGAGREMPDGKKPKPGGWNRIQLRVEDLPSLHSNLKERGATFRNEVVEGRGGRQVLLEDPSGNPVELFESAGKTEVQPVPDGYHTVTPFLLAEEAEKLIAFIEEAFNGEVDYLMKSEDGKVRHSTVRIGDSLVMISTGTDRFSSRPCMLHLYVPKVDEVYNSAISAGGETIREPADQFYGDRSAGVRDPWGNQWWLATHIEDVPDEEMERREKEFRENRKDR